MASGTLTLIQSGARKLLAKGNRVNVLQVHDGLIYAVSSSIEGTAFKVLTCLTRFIFKLSLFVFCEEDVLRVLRVFFFMQR